jgi:hypothetical protein
MTRWSVAVAANADGATRANSYEGLALTMVAEDRRNDRRAQLPSGPTAVPVVEAIGTGHYMVSMECHASLPLTSVDVTMVCTLQIGAFLRGRMVSNLVGVRPRGMPMPRRTIHGYTVHGVSVAEELDPPHLCEQGQLLWMNIPG